MVASGEMPYAYDGELPIRQLPNAWPGVGRPNIGISGKIIEQAMFVLNAELRLWNISQLDLLLYNCYVHPSIAGSGFEPKSEGETLDGLVSGDDIKCLVSVDNIEQMRRNFSNFLLGQYANSSVYGASDFLNAWLLTAYPESPSGSVVITQPFFPINIFSLTGRTYLRPELEDVVDGDPILTTDLHWLGGSGVIMDIDAGEVIFNPFPFPGPSNFFSPSTGNSRFQFGPVWPVVQTTAGAIPSVDASRYLTDISNGNLRSRTNFDALESGICQIDGYALINETIMELVKGNDNNVEGSVTFANDYTGHIEGLRRTLYTAGENAISARCYRSATAQPTGLYRFLTHNPKSDVPDTVIPSGFVSLYPQGQVIGSSPAGTQIQTNRIDGQQLVDRGSTSAGNAFELEPASAVGIHVFNDAIWTAGPNALSSGTFDSRGLFPISPFTGRLVWYRPAERVLSTSGNFGPGPAIFGAHLGLMDLSGDVVRVAKTALQIFETDVVDDEDLLTLTIYFQRYDQTTLDHTEDAEGYSIQGEDAGTGGFTGSRGLDGSVTDGSDVYIWTEFGTVHKFTTGLSFVNAYRGPIARRRYSDGSQLLYSTNGNAQVGDPLLAIPGGTASGIGVWTTQDPTGAVDDVIGTFTHDSGKITRLENFIQNNPFGSQVDINHIIEVTGASHVRNGTWMFFQSLNDIWLFRIVEQASQWTAVEGIELDDFADSGFPVGDQFPWEGIQLDID